MKAVMLGGLLAVASTLGGTVRADGMYWVVGNRTGNTCDIVTSNPVIDGNLWFEDGPYKSLADAKLARKTIRACPSVTEPEAAAPADDSETTTGSAK